MIQFLQMKPILNNNLPSTLRKQYYYLQIDVRSFNKIQLEPNWLRDLQNLIWLYNLKYYLHELKSLHRSWYLLKLDLDSLISSKDLDIYKSNLVFYYKLQKFIIFKYKFKEFLDLKTYLFKKISVTRLPIKSPRINILKSPHVFKKAQDHYEIRSHKLIINLPMLYWGKFFIENLLIRTSRLNSMNQVSFKRKKLIKMKNFKRKI